MWGKNSYIKANFLPGLLLHAGASAGRRGGSSRWRPPKASSWRYHVGLPPSLGNISGWGLPQQLNCGAATCCRLPRPGGAGEAMACSQVDLPAAAPAAQGSYSP